MSLAAERAAAAARRWAARLERTAAATLSAVGRDAALSEAEAYIRETWATLDDGQVEEILARVGTMREEPPRGRRLTPEEIEMAVTAKTRDTRAAIRELLERDAGMTATEMWERCRARNVNLTARTSFTNHCSHVRRELGLSGREAKKRAVRKTKATVRETAAKATPTGRPAVGHSITARQPSEEVAPTPRAPEPPPAAPGAEARPHPREVEDLLHRLQSEMLRHEQAAREIKIAIGVLERLVA